MLQSEDILKAAMAMIRVSKTDTDSKKTDTDTIFPNYPGYTDNGYTDIY